MAALVCDICGGKLVMQSGGVAKCDSCSMEYTKERIQEKVQEIKGTVKIDGPVETVKGDAEKERLIKTAQECFRKGAIYEANKMFRKISEDYPNEWRAWMGILYSESLCLTDDVIRDDFIRLNKNPNIFLTYEYEKALQFAPKEEQSKIKEYYEPFIKKLVFKVQQIKFEEEINKQKTKLEEEINKQKTIIKGTKTSLESANDVYNKFKKRNNIATAILIISIIGFIILFKFSTIGAICCIGGGVLAGSISPDNRRFKNANDHKDKLSKDLEKYEIKLRELERDFEDLKTKIKN